MKQNIGRKLLVLVAMLVHSASHSGIVSDVKNTKHNFSTTPFSVGTDDRTVKATSVSEICVFCHTPHNADASVVAPLWNRALSTANYTLYNSSSMDSAVNQPGFGSKICLSCHDGTLAIGAVNVLNGRVTDKSGSTAEIAMTGTGTGGVMPAGSGKTTGDTRDLGTDLSNDHPIAFTYNTALATADGDLRDPATTTSVSISTRVAKTNTRPDIPLLNDQVECVSCHDPHIRDTTNENIKFLRLNRFQINAGPGSDSTFSKTNDIICLSCHTKQGWTDSAHANPLVANELYASAAASVRDFPNALPVWRAACLNCHDTHTVQGARRLLREGTDSVTSPKAGGNSAIEETCYQCHSTGGNTLTSQGNGTEVPDIKSDFALARRMPITNTEQGGTEVHDIGTGSGSQRGKEFIESPTLLGKGNLANRHVECTDCHNPHRVTRNRSAFADPATPDSDGTHDHSGTTRHTNLVSGVLRGMWGIEPVYGATTWGSLPTSYTVKSGLQPKNGSTDVTNSYVTREYQICLKCHSDYAYDDTNRPLLGYTGGTPSGTNSMTQYTNQAMEFQAPSSEAGWPGRNHRSWHPVMAPTGRTMAIRGNDAAVFLPPWNSNAGADIGQQTLYCSDCHGSNTANGISGPGNEGGNNSGPHGSSNNFILKGDWSNTTGTNNQSHLCFKCHDYDSYANPNPAVVRKSGFRTSASSMHCMVNNETINLHTGHAARIGKMRCNWCHTMVPHGWQNKALLVDISQVGGGTGPFTQGPYYVNAMLGGGGPVTFAASGQWTSANCGAGGGGGMGGGGGGMNWMYMGCANPP